MDVTNSSSPWERSSVEWLPPQHDEPKRTVKSLTDLCIDSIQRKLLGKVDTLDVLDLANLLNLKTLREECLKAISFKYAFFKEVTDPEYLLELCGEEEIAKMEKRLEDTKEFRRYIRQEGSVLDKQVTEYSTYVVPSSDDDEASGQVYFPVEALLAGVEWPKGIDPSRRESWLTDEDFEKVFKMTREQFKKLPHFKRAALKKDVKLW